MPLIVMKFGGTSVATIEKIRNAAAHVKREADAGNQCVVVVSAMAGQTNRLVKWAKDVGVATDESEYDAVVSTGEQVTSGLLALVLQSLGVKARSWQGWQIPISTDSTHGSARIEKIETEMLISCLEAGQVCVIAGFQGMTSDNRIATLGRGGSDTTAVAIAAATGAQRCDIYTDVDGIYTADPQMVPRARRLDKISYEEMLEMASLGAKILQTRSVQMAMAHDVRLQVRSSFDPPEGGGGRNSGDNGPGTLVCSEDDILEKRIVSGIAYANDEAKVTLVNVADQPGVAAGVFGRLAEADINVDMIVQNVSDDGSFTDLTFTVQDSDLPKALKVLESAKDKIGYKELKGSTDIAKISVIGIGMRSHAGVAAQTFAALAEKGINIEAISTSEIKISVLIDAAYTELAVRTLHSLYGLDSS